MAFLYLQLLWHWVGLLQMGSSYTVIVMQREMRTINFQGWGTKTGWLMTASIIPLHLILADQIYIYLPSPLMIDPASRKDPDTPLNCSQLPSLLRMKIMLVIWPPLLIFHISFLLLILILSMLLGKMCLSKLGSTEDISVGNMFKKDAKKRQGYISPHALIRKRKIYYFRWFFRIISYTRTFFLEHHDYMSQLLVWLLCLPPFHIPPFTLPVEFVLCLFSSWYIDHSMKYNVCLIWLINRSCIFKLFEWMW